MKMVRIFLYIILMISSLLCVNNSITTFQRRAWLVTTATIDRIGLPDGIVFGTYTDQENIIHSGELYLDYFLSGYKTNADYYIDKKVQIMYDPTTNEVKSFDKLKKSWIVSIAFLIFSISALIYIKLKKRRMKMNN